MTLSLMYSARRQTVLAVAAGLAVLYHAPISAQTSPAVRARLAPLLSVEVTQRPIQVRVVEKRRYQSDTIALAAFQARLEDELSRGASQTSVSLVATALSPLSVTIGVEFLGYYRTSGGSWGGKALLSLDGRDARGEAAPLRQNVEFDTLLGRAVPAKSRSGSGSSAADQVVIEAAVRRAVGELRAWSDEASAGIRLVTAIGVTPATTKDAESMRRAILDALREGCARSWGVELEAVTKLVDLADVSETTRTVGRGLILGFEVLPEFTTLTSDGELFVIVQAIVTNPAARGND